MNYTAHIRYDEQQKKEVRQSVKSHLENSASFASDFLQPMQLSALGEIVGIFHDFGKLSKVFNDYIEYSYHHPEDHSRKGTIDHSTAGGLYLYRTQERRTEDEERTAEFLAEAIISHHSSLNNMLSRNGTSDFLRRICSEELPGYEEARQVFLREIMPEKDVKNLFQQAVQEITVLENRLDQIVGPEEDTKYDFYQGMIEKMIFSALIDADRLDTANFMDAMHYERVWDTQALWADCAQKLEQHVRSFPQETDIQKKKIAAARQKISDSCLAFANNPPGIYSLSVPTGSGKTLASMRFALAHAQANHMKRILVVIPYTSIIDQNAQELRAIFQHDEAVLEHHSNVVENVSMEALAMGEVKDKENEDAYSEPAVRRRSMTERWDVPIVFTTQVQFLNTLFAGGTKSIRRLHALQDSVIIFDEIQTLPVKCTFLFNEAMNFLRDFCHVTAVLCTATQPNLEKLPVPIKQNMPQEMVGNLDAVFAAFQRVRLENHYVEGGALPVEIVPYIWQDAIDRGNVLCIVNTTASARALYQSLQDYAASAEEKVELVHLSTKMCPAHRRQVLGNVRQLLQQRAAGSRLICISTQLIEAGVDVSFTTVYRALAGLASIAQAAGRCNRHGELPYGVVKLFALRSENLSRLQDIEKGVEVVKDMLPTVKAETLLHPDVLQFYFTRYYADRKKLMGYPVHTGDETLYDLLSLNMAGEQRRREAGKANPLLNMQAFQDAGKEFCVIDSQTVGVLTPFEKGETLIADFDGKIQNKGEIFKKIKESQQYMVNLFSYEVKNLAAMGAVWETKAGVLALRREQYDSQIGVDLENQKNKFLSI